MYVPYLHIMRYLLIRYLLSALVPTCRGIQECHHEVSHGNWYVPTEVLYMFSCMSALYQCIPCIQGWLVKCVPCQSVFCLWRYVYPLLLYCCTSAVCVVEVEGDR